ncbi:TrkH-domain-containing protein, partial [Saccharata proteae CBS 121410]
MRDLWDEVRHPRAAKQHFGTHIRDEICKLNFYRAHLLYFVVVILVSSVVVYGEGLANGGGEEGGGRLRYVDALFLCCSAMTTTGLNTVDLGSLTGFQQAVLAVLLLVGNVIFVSTFVVVLRRWMFKRKLSHIVQESTACRKVVEDLEMKVSKVSKERQADGLRKRVLGGDPSHREILHQRRSGRRDVEPEGRRGRYHHVAGFGSFPWPWEIPSVRTAFWHPFGSLSKELRSREESYVSFDPDIDEKGRFRNLTAHERTELGGVEYRALKALLWLLVIYQVFWLALGTVFLVPYAYRRSVTEILHSSQPGNLNPGWWGFFATVTSFANGGINVLNSNFIPFQSYYLVLIVSGALTVAGNTQFPIILRLSIWALSKAVPKTSRVRQTLLFLLHHPRRCFIYLFPSKETWYLFLIQLTIDLAMWVLFEVLNLGLPAVTSIPPGTRTIDGLFQATALRTSGAYIITISSLAPALLVAYLVAMYISSFPIVMALRQTNTYEERSVGLDENNGPGGLGRHLRRQLAYDIWFQMLAWFVIAIIERDKIVAAAPGFTIFSLLFEVTSAYGTVGLSTGVPYNQHSLSGAFQTGSKVVMLAVMLRGRHRGLPLAIDRSILLPGEDLMHRMDEEYNEDGKLREEDVDEVRRDEEESGNRGVAKGKGVEEQDPERIADGDRDGSDGGK